MLTPGRTAPDESVIFPLIVPSCCAHDAVEISARQNKTQTATRSFLTFPPLPTFFPRKSLAVGHDAATINFRIRFSAGVKYGNSICRIYRNSAVLLRNVPTPCPVKRPRKAYVGVYLKEEIQSEGLTRSIENFSRFLEV